MSEEDITICGICKWFEAYDDGDGYVDSWCDNPKVNITNWGETTFLYKDSEHCPYYEEVKEEKGE